MRTAGAPEPVGGPRSRTARDPDLSRDEILVLLRANPANISAACEGLPDELLARAPGPADWSAVQILAHLRACDDVWGGATRTILDQDRPTIRAVGPRSYVRRTGYLELPFWASFAAFRAGRDALIATLVAVPLDAWTRTAIVTGAGMVMERTLTWYALGLADHERQHVKPIERLAAALRLSPPSPPAP